MITWVLRAGDYYVNVDNKELPEFVSLADATHFETRAEAEYWAEEWEEIVECTG